MSPKFRVRGRKKKRGEGRIESQEGRKLPFAATWMDLEPITLNEIGQRETNTI